MFEHLFKDFELTEDEGKIIKWAETDQTRLISQAKVISEIYSIKRLEKIFDKLIKSNEEIAVSNGRQSRALNYLTAGIVFIGFVQLILYFIK